MCASPTPNTIEVWKCTVHRIFTLTANEANACNFCMSLSTFGKRLSLPSGDSEKYRSRALRDETIPSQPDVSMQICFVIALVGLTINFAPPAFAQQNDTVDAEIAQQVRALAFKL